VTALVLVVMRFKAMRVRTGANDMDLVYKDLLKASKHR
jgi:hypothetical protein